VDFAYEDRAFPIAANQTISHPSTVAKQTELLQVKPGEKILEIGTGSGYQTAVLVNMGAEVYTIERQKDLYDFSTKILAKINLNCFSDRIIIKNSNPCFKNTFLLLSTTSISFISLFVSTFLLIPIF